MKVSYNWLRDILPTELAVDTLSQKLTFAGLEVDDIDYYGAVYDQIVVAVINEVAKHPDADRLSVCQVSIGDGDNRQIVCGAPNVYAGMLAPLALPGAQLGPELTIKKSKIRGQRSQGMLLSYDELGFDGPSATIIDLPADAKPGQALDDYLQTRDAVLDIDLTPNRGDCLSVLGVARELAALTESQPPNVASDQINATHQETLNIRLADERACPLYSCRVIRDVDPQKPTPLWMQQRLHRAGIEPVHVIVDITNYVMLELGQPLHAFDKAKIGDNIVVRPAADKENLTFLDGQDRDIEPGTLIISDDNGPLALAGVMGGLASAVTSQTQDIVLESAHFAPRAIARSSQDNQIGTDSSARFERGVDRELPLIAMERASRLLVSIAGGEPGPINCARADEQPDNPAISLKDAQVQQILGEPIPQELCVKYLKRLQMAVTIDGDALVVTPPSFRFDITRPVDLVEELVRLHGYEAISFQKPQMEVSAPKIDGNELPLDHLRSFCNARGYHEAVNYAFVDPEMQQAMFADHNKIELTNPISQDMSQMRVSLLPGLVNTVAHNQNRQRYNMRLFEKGAVFVVNQQQTVEEERLALILSGNRYPEQWSLANEAADFYDIKSDVQGLFAMSGLQYSVSAEPHPALHPGRCGHIYRNRECVGIMGELHPSLMRKWQLKGPILLAELDWQRIIETKLPKMAPLSKYPEVKRDIALIVNEELGYGQLETVIWQIASPLLKKVQIFDIYQGHRIGKGQKSLALRLYFQHQDRTLVDKEINGMTQTITDELVSRFDATLRGPANGSNKS